MNPALTALIEPDADHLDPADRLRTAFELAELGAELARARHRAAHVEATPEELAAVAADWWAEPLRRPPPPGQRVVPWPRR